MKKTNSHATRQGTLGHSPRTQLAEPLWTDPGLKSVTGVSELISTDIYIYIYIYKKRSWGVNRRISPQVLEAITTIDL